MAKRMMEDLVFNQMLCSEGYKVDYAVGTTYSLDLSTFMSLPFSLGFIEDPDEAMRSSVAYLFTALRVCSSKLAVFCNFSDIKVPEGHKKIFYSLVEGSIFSVNPARKPQELINFHPKVWVIQESEINGDSSRIKVIVMSRNLTGDNSLDVVCEITGEIKDKEAPVKSLEKHKPLWDFLNYLKRYADDKKRRMIEKLISSIKRVKAFDLSESPFDDYSFVPMGIKEHFNDGRELLDRLHQSREAVVISPFIDNHVLDGLIGTECKTLITREMSLTQSIVDNFGKDDIYITNQQMLDNEELNTVDLHAKIYYTREHDFKQHMFLGSTNATRNGFERNVEFLLGLRFAPYQCSYEKFRENFINSDKDCKFEQMIDIPETAGDKREELRQTLILRQNIATIQNASVYINDTGKYDVVVSSCEEYCTEAAIYPLMCPEKKAALTGTVVFQDIELEKLSEFYVIEVDESRRLIKIQTEGIPESRDDAICRKVMNKDQFMDCICFLLAESKKAYVAEKMMNEKLMGEGTGGDASRSQNPPALYEELLRAAYERPDVFDDMESFIRSLPEDIVPADFNRIYNDIRNSLKNYTR